VATPLYSVYVRQSFPRAIKLAISAMAADPVSATWTLDLGLQLLLEAHRESGCTSVGAEEQAILDQLVEHMLPRSLAQDPLAERIMLARRHDGRRLLGDELENGTRVFHLDRNYRAFCHAADHYIYCTEPETDASLEAQRGSVSLVVVGRFRWLFSSIRPGLSWESTAFSFAMYA
jgi:hypothetical protein